MNVQIRSTVLSALEHDVRAELVCGPCGRHIVEALRVDRETEGRLHAGAEGLGITYAQHKSAYSKRAKRR